VYLTTVRVKLKLRQSELIKRAMLHITLILLLSVAQNEGDTLGNGAWAFPKRRNNTPTSIGDIPEYVILTSGSDI
jgi:carbohydrate-binding DOMON domain-containing protein